MSKREDAGKGEDVARRNPDVPEIDSVTQREHTIDDFAQAISPDHRDKDNRGTKDPHAGDKRYEQERFAIGL